MTDAVNAPPGGHPVLQLPALRLLYRAIERIGEELLNEVRAAIEADGAGDLFTSSCYWKSASALAAITCACHEPDRSARFARR